MILQGQNAEITSSLPSAINQIIQTAAALSKVSHQLASTNFKNFESIANEIREAADEVANSTSLLANSILILSSNDNKKEGWENLIRACRIMATKTIQLLQIIYASDLKKIFETAEQVLNLIKDHDLSQASHDPSSFADWATSTATKANQLATYLLKRANEEESPYLAGEIEDFGKKLKSEAENTIELANELLENPENKDLQNNLKESVDNIDNFTADAMQLLRESNEDSVFFDENKIPTLSSALKQRLMNLESARQKQIQADAEMILAQRKSNLLNINPQDSTTQNLVDVNSRLSPIISKFQNSLRDLINIAMNDNQKTELDKASKKTADLFSKLLNSVDEEIQKSKDPIKKLKLNESNSQVKEWFPKQMGLAEDVFDDSTEVNHPKLLILESEGNDLLKKIEELTRNGNINDDLMQASQILDQNEPIQKYKQELLTLTDQLVKEGNLFAKNAVSEQRQRDIMNAVLNLQNAAKKLVTLKNFDDEISRKEYKKALEDLKEQTNSDCLNAFEYLRQDLDALNRSALSKNKAQIKFVLNDLKRDGEFAVEKSKKQKQNLEKNQFQRLDDAIKDFNSRLKDEIDAIEFFLKSEENNVPNHQTALAKIISAQRPLRDTIKYLEQVVDGQIPEIEYLKNVSENEEALSKSIVDINDTLIKLKESTLLLESKSKNSKSSKILEELDAILKYLDKQSSSIVQNLTSDNSKQSIISNLLQILEFIDQLETIETPVLAISTLKRLVESNKKFQTELADSEKQFANINLIKEQIKNLPDLMSNVDTASKTMLKEQNLQNKQQYSANNQALKAAYERILNLIYPNHKDETLMCENSENIQAYLEQIAKMNKNDPVELKKKLIELEKSNGEYLKAAQNRKKQFNPNKIMQNDQKDPLQEFKDLAKRIGHFSNQIISSPNDKKLKEFNLISEDLKRSMKKNNSIQAVYSIAAFQDVDNSLNAISQAVFMKDSKDLVNQSKNMSSLLNKLSNILNDPDLKNKKQIEQYILETHKNVTKLIEVSVKALKSNDKSEIDHLICSCRVPISKAISNLSPCNDRYINQSIREAQESIDKKSPDAKKMVEKVIAETSENARSDKENLKNLSLLQSVSELSELNSKKEFDSKKINKTLDNLYSILNTDEKTQVVKDVSKAISNSQELQDLIKDSKDSNLPIDNSKIISKSNTLQKKMLNIRDTAPLLFSNTGLPPSLNDKKSSSQKINQFLEPKNFEEALENAASSIISAVETSSSPKSVETIAGKAVAEEMLKLSKAAKSGKRQEMILSSRNVSEHLKEIINEINSVIKKIGSKNPKQVDQLMRTSSAIRNYAIQLKILTSVKGASIERNIDNDDTLLSITQSLGVLVSESLGNIDRIKNLVLKDSRDKK